MSTAHVFPESNAVADRLSEFDALVAAGPSALDAIPGAVYLVDREGRLVCYNHEAAELWGRTPQLYIEHFCGSHRLFLSDGAPLAHDACPMADAVRSGASVRNAEVVIERPDGSRITALVNIRALKDRQGAIQGAINCFQNIGSVKQMEADLRRKNADLEDFFENSAIGLHIVNGEGVIVRANKAELDMLGYSAAEYVGRPVADFHADPPVIQDILNRLSCGQSLDRYPARLRAKDGSIKHVLITSNSRFESGAFVNTRCFTLDVTDAKRLEDRIRESERQLREVLEALPAAVYTTDAEGRINFYNKAAVELAGRVPELGEQWCVTWKLYSPDGAPLPHDQCPMAIALKTGTAVRGAEAVAERPDGTRVPFQPYPTPLRDAEGNLSGAINMLIDISERKAAEERQRVLIDELNHRVKNTLATVQSLAQQTARHVRDLGDFNCSFESRLLGLAHAHDLLTRSHWGRTPLRTLIAEAMAPAAAQRITADGPFVQLNPKAALALAMVLNELLTNAMKYGALSAEGGDIHILWAERDHAQGPALAVEWREQGGPRVTPPKASGFGSKLMRRCIENDLGGTFELSFAPAGVQVDLTVPLSELR